MRPTEQFWTEASEINAVSEKIKLLFNLEDIY